MLIRLNLVSTIWCDVVKQTKRYFPAKT